ncbi:Per1-like protein [Radiomyces spectabilis]|uniref:Per1-like protein n=1 Tax=Radiomyces spectabilis TaxID=64574 RepID=UPI00221E8872|nr:Per1-like protein [Radiomyces spectabilis]KAI8369239.1 Per1-like protein [Radiomyces spectabilis]
MKSWHVKLCIVIFLFIGQCLASPGDLQPSYQDCIKTCAQEHCPAPLPLVLRLMQWTCPENCRYTCMQKLTDKAIAESSRVLQYHGKWPFYRFLGVQEPASVVFSIGNGLVHYKYFHVLQQQIPQAYYLRPFMLTYALVGINTWIWSTVFHARDFPLTEKLDYFCSGLLILYSFYFACLRIFRIRQALFIRALSILCLGMFLGHVYYLSFVTFDYGYNMLASVLIGTLQLTLWVGWCCAQYVKPENASRRPYAYKVLVSVLGVAVAMSLELFDFPPIFRIFDAHSLWHLSTIPLMVVWYQFILTDTWHELHTKWNPVAAV